MLNILVVDDSKVARKRTIATIESFNIEHSITHAIDGEDALKAFALKKHNLVITDLEMPNMDGLELIAKLREISKELDIIIITAVANEQIKQLFKSERYTSFIRKPIDTKVLEAYLLKTQNHILKGN